MSDTMNTAAQPEESTPSGSRTLWGDAWARLRKNKLAMIGAAWIIFVILIAVTADL